MRNEIKTPSWKSWAMVIGSLAAVFTALVIAVTLQSRQEIRQQIVDRDAEVLASVARMLQTAHEELPGDPVPADDLEIALQTSRLRGVIAVRLFDNLGRFSFAIPFEVAELDLTADEQDHLETGEPLARFHPRAPISEVLEYANDSSLPETLPLQEVIIPLFSPDHDVLIGSIQYLIDGETVQTEFAALDRTLWLQGGVALAIGIGALVLIAGFNFARLRRSHFALADRTERLVKANQELALAARTSAVGAVTSHLIHGIRNPLTGLDLFFQTRNPDELPGQSPESWRQLAEATNRIRELVDEVVEVLREQGNTTAYELTLEEFASVLDEKLRPKTDAAEIHFEIQQDGDGELSANVANILLLIVINLVDNALHLTPKGKGISVSIARNETEIRFEVADEGPGIPESMRETLFTPGQSSRPGGSGLGLAISHRLASHIGAELELLRSNEEGTVFVVRCPLEKSSLMPGEKPVEAPRGTN